LIVVSNSTPSSVLPKAAVMVAGLGIAAGLAVAAPARAASPSTAASRIVDARLHKDPAGDQEEHRTGRHQTGRHHPSGDLHR
jgi:hypothetical protein